MKKHSARVINEYNEVYRTIFHKLGFDDTKRELCYQLTNECVKLIARAQKLKTNYKQVVNYSKTL